MSVTAGQPLDAPGPLRGLCASHFLYRGSHRSARSFRWGCRDNQSPSRGVEMDAVRHVLGVVGIATYPPALLFWFVIHPWARWWRRLGPAGTYLIMVPVLVFVGGLLFRVRGPLLGADLGTNWTLVGVALAFLAVSVSLEPMYRGQLSVTTLIGIPELLRTSRRSDTLLTEGVYRVVRHPRYLSVAIGLIGYALIANYVGLYVVALAAFPTLYAIAILEERELVDRFGEVYRAYQREVPRFIPRLKKLRQSDGS
jgi:protein-S-isoprenylcysteine O-methyltransferase Ste14